MNWSVLLGTEPVGVRKETHTWSEARDYFDTFVFPTDGNGCNIACVEISSMQVGNILFIHSS